MPLILPVVTSAGLMRYEQKECPHAEAVIDTVNNRPIEIITLNARYIPD